MKKLFSLLAGLAAFYFVEAQQVQQPTTSQPQKPARHKIAIFTPMYLDSVFDASGNVRLEKNNFPRYVIPGLEFYQGAQAAIDSLEKRNAPIEFFLFDSRGKEPLQRQLNRPELKDVDLIIAQTNAPETKFLAEVAAKRKIPFISASFPNDAGTTNNPYFVILNSTLQTHIEKIYEFVQQNHSQDRVVIFRKNGAQEDQLRDQFINYSKKFAGKAVDMKVVNLPASFKAEHIISHLDSNKRNIIIAGSLDETFGMHLLNHLSSVNTTYPVRVMGMPNWERFNLSKLGSVEIIYTTPFYYNRLSPLETKLADDYASNISARPGEMYFRGYETTLRFALLLLDTKKEVASSLSRKGNTIFTPFEIQPVIKDSSLMVLDYFENRNLYFIKNFGGSRIILNN
jgi:hypothetical protein